MSVEVETHNLGEGIEAKVARTPAQVLEVLRVDLPRKHEEMLAQMKVLEDMTEELQRKGIHLAKLDENTAFMTIFFSWSDENQDTGTIIRAVQLSDDSFVWGRLSTGRPAKAEGGVFCLMVNQQTNGLAFVRDDAALAIAERTNHNAETVYDGDVPLQVKWPKTTLRISPSGTIGLN